MAGRYHSVAVAELAKELAAGLLRLRKGYVDSADALLRILDSKLEYPYDFVVYRLTGYRPHRPPPAPPLAGGELADDLRQLILQVCDSFDLPAAAYGEPAIDVSGLARRFRVSTKTVQRWRRQGLVARKLVLADGHKRLAFLESSLRDFAHRRRQQILRGARFSQMTPAQRQQVIEQARVLARQGAGPHEVARRVASATGRAVETIRYTIRRHDAAHPDQAVFVSPPESFTPDQREVIYRCFLHGVGASTLARRYGRSRGSIYRVINDMRCKALAQRKIGFIYNPIFELPAAQEQIMTDPPAAVEASQPLPRVPKDLPPYLRSLYELPLLSSEQERRLFCRYNYLKFKADRLRSELSPEAPAVAALRRAEQLLAQADVLKNQIIRANLRLVVSIAKKHLSGPQELHELISDGNVSLMKAVEKFDFSRGFKFSTYASWAVMKNFARSVPRERYLLDRFLTGSDEAMDVEGSLKGYDPHACSLVDLRESLETMLAQLSPRERNIIVHHYGLDQAQQARTFEEISHDLGISKERVRQIERRAMDKLRELLGPVEMDLMR